MTDATNPARPTEFVTAADEVPRSGTDECADRRSSAACAARKVDGTPCRMRPGRGAAYCFSHDPERVAEAAAARRRGGQRRRSEHATAAAYRVQGVASISDVRRVLEIALLDALELENSIGRARVLIFGCGVLLKLHETAELDDRLQALEIALRPLRTPRGLT